MALILKIPDDKTNTDYYLEWSTICDAPLTHGMSLGDFREYYNDQYGKQGMKEYPERMERVEETGNSSILPKYSNDDFYNFNRAGGAERCTDKEGILEKYCRNKVPK